TKLDKSVAAGDITAAQETTILNHATTALTNLVNNTKPDKLHAGLRQAGLRLALPRPFLFPPQTPNTERPPHPAGATRPRFFRRVAVPGGAARPRFPLRRRPPRPRRAARPRG